MGFIAVTCPKCGSNAEVDSSTKIGMCNYCGTQIIPETKVEQYVSKNTYTTNQVINKTIIGREKTECEEYISKAETYLKIGEEAKAKDAYEGAIDADPGNYRGWLGLYCLDHKPDNLIKALKLADPEEYTYITALGMSTFHDVRNRYFKGIIEVEPLDIYRLNQADIISFFESIYFYKIENEGKEIIKYLEWNLEEFRTYKNDDDLESKTRNELGEMENEKSWVLALEPIIERLYKQAEESPTTENIKKFAYAINERPAKREVMHVHTSYDAYEKRSVGSYHPNWKETYEKAEIAKEAYKKAKEQYAALCPYYNEGAEASEEGSGKNIRDIKNERPPAEASAKAEAEMPAVELDKKSAKYYKAYVDKLKSRLDNRPRAKDPDKVKVEIQREIQKEIVKEMFAAKRQAVTWLFKKSKLRDLSLLEAKVLAKIDAGDRMSPAEDFYDFLWLRY